MSDSYLTRETLLKRLKSMTDEEAWEEFIEKYEGFIYSIIRKMHIIENDVEDLYQKIMVTLWESLPKFDYGQKQGKFRNWLYTVSKNTVIAYLKSNTRYQKHIEEIEAESQSMGAVSELDRVIDEEWEKHIVAMAFKNIEGKVSKQAVDVFLASLENEEVAETAARMQLSESSVYVYRMRVKNALIAEIDNLRTLLE